MASLASSWVEFFIRAGIPADEAASYALIFTRNRIQRNMLADLNKEYLKDMGITLLGDVIAILKHAQAETENESRAFVMSQRLQTDENETQLKPPIINMGSPSVKNLIDRYTKQYEEAEKSLALVPKSEVIEDLPYDTIPEPKEKPPPQLKAIKPSSTLSKKRKFDQEETEIMPKQKKMKSSHTDLKVDKASIFARLGDSSVSSTTSEVTAVVKKTSMSVFSRLGDMLAAPPIQTSVSSDKIILKEKSSSSKIPSLSMRADQIQMKKDTPKSIMATLQKKTDFLKARDLEMLKITTEFSDDDDVVASDSQLPPEKKPDSNHTIIRRFTEKGEIDIIDSTDCTSLISDSQQKRVRFGSTTTRILPAEPKKRRNPISFPNHNILAKKLHAARLVNKKKQLSSLGALNQLKKANNLISKMVSDTMSVNRIKLSVKNRMQIKNKVSVLDRLG